MKKEIAVALSGGGFSGFWPMLGAADELRKRHNVSAWAGTSAGSIVAAIMASDVDIAKVVGEAMDVDLAPRDIRLSEPSVKSPDVLLALLRRHLPPTLGDVKTRLRICTSNLTTGRAVVWCSERHGWAPLPELVLASAAIPFAFPPVKIGRYWHTDGGITHNMLSDAFPETPTVAISAFSRSNSARPSGWIARIKWLASRVITAALASNIREDIEDAENLISIIEVPRPAGSLKTLWRTNEALDAMIAGAHQVPHARHL